MPIAGFTRFREHQVGAQTSISSNSAATRVLPYRGAITVDPAREQPDIDEGSLDPITAPLSGAKVVEGTWEGPLAYDDAPYIWAGLIKGGVTPTGGGTAKTWTFQAASLTADTFQYYTDQWGDDVTNDWINAGGGTIDSLQLGFDEDLGPFDVNADLVYANADLGGSPTGGLTLTASPIWVYGADTEVYVDTAFGSVGTTKWTDTIHAANTTVNNNLDRKRYANGSNTRFNLAGYGRGAREILVELTVAKTAAAIAERATLDDDPVPARFIELKTTSPSFITGSTPYSQSIRVPARLISAEDDAIGGNSVIRLTYRGFYSPDLGYALRTVVVCALATL
jgi:hypothetical protein